MKQKLLNLNFFFGLGMFLWFYMYIEPQLNVTYLTLKWNYFVGPIQVKTLHVSDTSISQAKNSIYTEPCHKEKRQEACALGTIILG